MACARFDHDVADVSDLDWMIPGVVVSRAGTATVSWRSSDYAIRTADDPPSPDDPQDPAHGDQETYLPVGDHLAVDAADVQTMVYQKSVRLTKNGFNEIFDLVLIDRIPGSGWSSLPEKVRERVLDADVELAVNASGAAVVVWSEFPAGGNGQLNAIYRAGAAARWTAPQRVPNPPDTYTFEVGVDDAGRVLVVGRSGVDWSPSNGEHEGVWAIRRSPAGEWGKTQQLSGPGTNLLGMAVGAGGAAVAFHSHSDGDGRLDGPLFVSRMSPSGHWAAPVGQPGGLGGTVAIDAKGRALITGWDGSDLMGRWGLPGGRWLKPFVLSADVEKTRHWGLAARVAINRRGDAIVGWGAQGAVAELWARYKPVGQEWTHPVRLSRGNTPPRWFDVAVGECGHVAFALSTADRDLQVVRASPRP